MIPKWNTVRIREDTYREIENVLEYDEVKKQGISSISQFVTNTLTKGLDEYSGKRPSYKQLGKKIDEMIDIIKNLQIEQKYQAKILRLIEKYPKVIDSPLKEKITEFEHTRFNNITTHDDHLRILDNKIGKLGQIVSVYFRKNNDMWCDYCDETNCVHVQYAKEIPHMKQVMEKPTYNNFRSVIVKDTYIEIFDDGIRNGIPVKITYGDKKLHCEECDSFNCNHVKYVWSIEHISKQLEDRGLVILEKTCPKCGTVANKTEIEDLFGYRKSNNKIITQSWCRYCRTKQQKELKRMPKIDKYF